MWTGGVLHPRSGQGGYPIPGLDRGVPHPADGGYPHPRSGWRVPEGSAKRALATQRAVCLLRSRRRTFLFFYIFR